LPRDRSNRSPFFAIASFLFLRPREGFVDGRL
jgi:hypothetical protein